MQPDDTQQRLVSCVDECRRGSVQSFEPVVDHFKRPIFSYVMKTVRNRQDAEDICQEVFLSAYRYLHTYKPHHKLSTWLFTIAHNTVARHLRKQASGTIPVDPAAIEGLEHTPRAGIAEPGDLIDLALHRVAPEERELIILHYREDFSYREMAEILGMTEPQIRMRLYRTRKKIREIIARKEEPC